MKCWILKPKAGEPMYTKAELLALLQGVQSGTTDIDTAFHKLKQLPYSDLGYAKIDNHRALRNGFPEVIYCPGKDMTHIVGIAEKFVADGVSFFATRATEEIFEAVRKVCPAAVYDRQARIITIGDGVPVDHPDKFILVMTAGTADIAVAQEAAITARMFGNRVETLFDVGVSGLHRLLDKLELVQSASVIIVAAGMEGALASVVGGLVDVPVVAVPTSTGYGTSFGGVTALLAMLSSCAGGVGVVGIDNGFGAAYLASTILQSR